MFLADRQVGGSLNMACQEFALEAQMEEGVPRVEEEEVGVRCHRKDCGHSKEGRGV